MSSSRKDVRPIDEVMTLLNAKNQSYEIASSGGAATRLTRMDVAAALGMGDLNPLSALVGRVRHCEDLPAAITLHRVLEERMRPQASPELSFEQTRTVVALAMDDFFNEKLCRKCRGRKFNRLGKPCDVCFATGVGRKPSERYYADQAQMTRHPWRTYGQGVLQKVSEMLQRAEAELSKHLRDKWFNEGMTQQQLQSKERLNEYFS